jgi:hypothetical protein
MERMVKTAQLAYKENRVSRVTLVLVERKV